MAAKVQVRAKIQEQSLSATRLEKSSSKYEVKISRADSQQAALPHLSEMTQQPSAVIEGTMEKNTSQIVGQAGFLLYNTYSDSEQTENKDTRR